MSGAAEDELLAQHLRAWLGQWPPRTAVDVVGADVRTEPGWDGRPRPFLGVSSATATLLSVPPDRVAAVREAVDSYADVATLAGTDRIPALVGLERHVVGRGVFRCSTRIASADELPDAGEWVDPRDPRVPEWLHPFNGGILIAWDGRGAYGAGVGIKRHDAVGREIAVVTEPALRGKGVARRLVAQAARCIIADGGLPTYLHDPGNEASARVADAVGFPDRGWSVWGAFEVS